MGFGTFGVRMDTVLITGSSGFLGRALAARLEGRYRVVGLDLAADEAGAAQTLRMDLTSAASIDQALAEAMAGGGALASVVHLAAYYDLSGEEDPKYQSVTVEGTRRLLRALQRYRPQQFVLTSTLLVHADTEPGHPIDETAPFEPEWAYPRSKARAEQVVAEEGANLRTVTLRPAGIYDEDCRAAFLAQQIARIYERLLISRFYSGDVSTGQPFLHVQDFCAAVERVIERRARLPQHAAYLLGETQSLSYEALQDRIGVLIHGDDWATFEAPKRLARVGVWMQEELLDQDPFIRPWMIDIAEEHYEIDISRARRDLGWLPQHSIAQTLPEMIARLKADPPRWYAINKLDPARVAARGGALRRGAAFASGLARDPDAAAAADLRLEQQRAATQWAHFLTIALGAWLIVSPWSYGLFDPVAAAPPPAAGRVLAAPEVRNAWLAWSEMASGALALILGALSMRAGRGWAQWGVAAIGVWVMSAPLVFWTTSPAAYNIDTLIGSLLIVLAVMVPPQPGIARAARMSQADLPLGWTYSPSTYVQRAPIVALAFAGFFISRYLAAYQLGHIEGLWDPLFSGRDGRNGSETVVTSWLSRDFPIPDAGLGAVAYMLDILTGAIGGRARWRTMPWLVLAFGLLIVPLGAVSVGFIIIQPPLLGALCALCLVQAAITVILIPYAIDEVLASAQYLWQAKRAGQSLWRTLWCGGPPLWEGRDPSPDMRLPLGPFLRQFLAGGVTSPWTLIAATLLGAALLAAPVLLGAEGALYVSDHIIGCLVITIAVTAMAEVARLARFAMAPLGVWLALSPFVLGESALAIQLAHAALGVALIGLSLPRGPRSKEHYGAWDRFVA